MCPDAVYLAYAKINIYLDVLNKRRDGFHNLETIFQSVSLSDRLEFFKTNSEITLWCDTAELRCDESNLVIRAARALQKIAPKEYGIHIRLFKKIPLAAGLAGGSADAAATLVALNELWSLHLPLSYLSELALHLGSDVPYCLVGGAQAGRLRGNDLYPLSEPMHIWIILVHPNVCISTREIFNHPNLTYSAERPFAGWTSSFRRARQAYESGDIRQAVYNRFETVVFSLYPELGEIKTRLVDAGCITAGMSGSGPTVFGICDSHEKAVQIARKLANYRLSVVCPTRVGVNCITEV